MSNFLTYKKFQFREEADELIDLLEEHNVVFEIEDNTRGLSDTFLGQDFDSKILIKLKPEQFTEVNILLDDHNAKLVDNIDKEYHLFLFSNAELMEIISEPDKWSELDKQLAKKILKERGVEISKNIEDALYEKRIKELSTKTSGNTIWTIVGYFSSLLGGILGIAIGLTLWKAHRTLPNGKKVYIYKDNDRIHGFNITIIGIIVFCIVIFIQIKHQVFFNFRTKIF